MGISAAGHPPTQVGRQPANRVVSKCCCLRDEMSAVCGTMSKAFEKSIDMVTALCGGLGCLQPRANLCARGSRAVVVE